MRQQHEEPDRYARYWSWVANLTRNMQGHVCCFPDCDRPIWQIHHAVYLELNEWGELVPIKGHEQPGVHVFGLCKEHHGNARQQHLCHQDAAHHYNNWIRGKVQPDLLDARNTPEYYQRLVCG
jgi:hypothetical protein